jgi:hypothetical protein
VCSLLGWMNFKLENFKPSYYSRTSKGYAGVEVNSRGYYAEYVHGLFFYVFLHIEEIYYFYSVKTQQLLSYIFISVLHVSARLSHLQVHISVY